MDRNSPPDPHQGPPHHPVPIQRRAGGLLRPAEEVRTLEVARLDAMLLALWPQVKQGNQGAIEKALKVEERRAKLLGLDAPAKIAPTDPTGEDEYSGLSDEELTRRLRAILGDTYEASPSGHGNRTAEPSSGLGDAPAALTGGRAE